MKIIEIINERTSWRTYQPKLLEKDVKEKLISFMNSPSLISPFDGHIRFQLIEVPNIDPNEKQRLGTYGFIQGAQQFIVGLAQQGDHAWENYGYILEKIILYATELGLGTCWLGGTFNRTAFSNITNPTDNEFIPAITPIGYPAKRRFKETIIRTAIRANKRTSWDQLFFEGDLGRPLSPEKSNKYQTALEMVHLGPSASNKQPWRIIKEINSNKFHFYILGGVSSYNKMRRLDIGIAVCHFDLTVKEMGLGGNWEFKDPHFGVSSNLNYIITWTENS